MKTMEKLCRRFEKLNPGYKAELDKISSYVGWYIIYITEPVCGTTSTYYATGCREFKEWMDNVVLD